MQLQELPQVPDFVVALLNRCDSLDTLALTLCEGAMQLQVGLKSQPTHKSSWWGWGCWCRCSRLRLALLHGER